MVKKRVTKKTAKKVEKKDQDTLINELKAYQEVFKAVSEELDSQRSQLNIQLKRSLKLLGELKSLPQEQLVAVRSIEGNLEVSSDLLKEETRIRDHILWSGVSMDLAVFWPTISVFTLPGLFPKVDKKDDKKKLKLLESAIKTNQIGITTTNNMRKLVLDSYIDLKLWTAEVIKYAEDYETLSDGQKTNVNNLIDLSLTASKQLITTINRNGDFEIN
ncbi:hypothetical protein ACUIJQ_07785 [Levilactobacillus hammesii]|uniref:Uncharacterized protein n=1 Tax=Levilactobacillus hammesii DSM 16381 TaxID=1423753 RepID=A0A0R1UIP7_9LACO|nr:hypothetical protein [Levilactobacillus hammesii]KRL93248.1 hypothetical protein FD28_GL001494 [Levilactobacillus hammesii DSM 16381]